MQVEFPSPDPKIQYSALLRVVVPQLPMQGFLGRLMIEAFPQALVQGFGRQCTRGCFSSCEHDLLCSIRHCRLSLAVVHQWQVYPWAPNANAWICMSEMFEYCSWLWKGQVIGCRDIWGYGTHSRPWILGQASEVSMLANFAVHRGHS